MSEAAHVQPVAGPTGGRAARFLADRQAVLAWGGGVLALAIGAVLFTRFSIDGNLWRDEAIYAYGGQQLAHGVPVYLGIFDPKPPLPTFLTALGALAGRAAGKDELVAMRAEFFVWALLTVVAALLVGGEEPRWRRGARAVAGVAVPLVATVLFLAIDGGLPQFIEASFTFPATGLRRGHVTLVGNLQQIHKIVSQYYGDTRVLFWAGLALLVVVLGAWLVRRRLRPERVVPAAVVLGTFAALAAASAADFQGYPD